jgi:hypothetical protein
MWKLQLDKVKKIPTEPSRPAEALSEKYGDWEGKENAYRTFWTCRGSFWKIWGLRPRVLYWVYTVIVKPTITYTTLVWWPRVRLKTNRTELSKLYRIACSV